MKCYRQTCIAILTLLTALAMPLGLAAQDASAPTRNTQHHHYKLVDLGTLGGPHSYGSFNGDGFSLLNNSGVVASLADTALPDPNAPQSCFNPDCFLAHAFRWEEGAMTDLGALPGINNSAAGAINSRGWIAGTSQTGSFDPILNGPGAHAVLWKDGDITDLASLGGGASLGIFVNDAGQVIGISDNTTPDPFSLFGIGVQTRTFLWQHGVMQDIGTLGGPDALPGASCSGQPRDVIVGMSYTGFTPNPTTGVPTLDPFLWKKGTMMDLGNLGGTMAAAQCANNRGQIIGFSTLAGDVMNHAFSWNDGVLSDLGTLGGDNSEAIWINDAGDVVGSADLPGSQIHDAVIWKNGRIHDLGTVTGDPCSRGRGLNARGQVVGGSSDCHNFLHAFVWEEGGSMLDLNTLIAAGSGYQLTNAFNINDRGEILAKAAPLDFTPNDDADLGHLALLIPCDDDHPGIEGCDYSMVDATVAASVVTPVPKARTASPTNQDLPAVGGFANPMLRRFGPRFGPWSRGMGAAKPDGTPAGEIPPSASKATLAEPLLDESRAVQILPPESCVPSPDAIADSTGAHAHGLCVRDWTTDRLNGGCVGRNPWNPVVCAGKYVPTQCQVGAKAKIPELIFCLPARTFVPVDAGRSCNFVWP